MGFEGVERTGHHFHDEQLCHGEIINHIDPNDVKPGYVKPSFPCSEDSYVQTGQDDGTVNSVSQARQAYSDKLLKSVVESLQKQGVLSEVVAAIKKGGNLQPDQQAQLMGKIFSALKKAGPMPQVSQEDIQRVLAEQAKAGQISPEQQAALQQILGGLQNVAQARQSAQKTSDNKGLGLDFLYPDPATEIMHVDPSKSQTLDTFTLNEKQQGELNEYGDKIKNVLAWNIMTQMLVKGSQMALDSFMVAEKWQYEQQITVMQFMQTMAQLCLGYINNMKQSWDQLWANYKQKQEQIDQAELKAFSGG